MAVLILNTDDTALHTVSLQHAIGMLVRKVAVVEAAHPDLVFGSFPQPEVLRLVRYVKTTFLYSRVPGWTKRGVLKRDRHTCGYCGERAATVDTYCRSAEVAVTPGPTPSPLATAATRARPTTHRPRRVYRCGKNRSRPAVRS